jgi:multiple sugar transport system ATP-binding protein
MAEVNLRNISKSYEGGNKVVHSISLDIKDKEFVVLVGPSGCGKSTTLRMIAGLEEITGGELQIDGKIVNNLPPKDRDIAMVFQNYALYPHMSVKENMSFGLKLRKMPSEEINERVLEAAKILELEGYLDRKPKALSGGQRQRVAVGRAIVRKPKVFLFDEPLSNLDAKLRVQMRAEISRLHKQLGATMIYVTHDQVEAMTMGDRICVLDKGYIQQFDEPMNLYERPANKFVAGFIGSPSMNFIKGKLTKELNNFVVKGNEDSVSVEFSREKYEKKLSGAAESVIIGIRPEHFRPHSIVVREGVNVIEVVLDMVEFMGNEEYLHFTLEGNKCVARVNTGIRYKEGDKVHLEFESSRVHLFDATSEENILLD